MGSNSSSQNTKGKKWKQVVFLRMATRGETNNEKALRGGKKQFSKVPFRLMKIFCNH